MWHRRCLWLVASVLLLGVPPASIANEIELEDDPFAYLIVDGEKYGIEIASSGDDGKALWIIPEQQIGSEGIGFTATITGRGDPDPSIAYGLAVTDFGAPSVFGFFFGIPIVPTGAPNVVTGSVVGGLTDLTGDGVSITPTAVSLQVNDVGFPITNMGVDVGAPFASGPGVPGSFYAYGPYAAGPIAGPGPGPWTFLSTSAGFGLSGGGDIAALTGFASIDVAPVPEPATLALLAVGAFALAGIRRRSIR